VTQIGTVLTVGNEQYCHAKAAPKKMAPPCVSEAQSWGNYPTGGQPMPPKNLDGCCPFGDYPLNVAPRRVPKFRAAAHSSSASSTGFPSGPVMVTWKPCLRKSFAQIRASWRESCVVVNVPRPSVKRARTAYVIPRPNSRPTKVPDAPSGPAHSRATKTRKSIAINHRRARLWTQKDPGRPMLRAGPFRHRVSVSIPTDLPCARMITARWTAPKPRRSRPLPPISAPWPLSSRLALVTRR
jgi:hypothetical protein